MKKPEILVQDNVISEPDTLYEALAADIEWNDRIKAGKTASFGQSYTYSSILYEVRPMHPLLVPVVDTLEGLLGFRLNNCLLNFDETGDSPMGYHSGSTDKLAPGTGVAVVSLGAERRITFRSMGNIDDTYPYLRRARSLLYISQEIEHGWKHAFLKQTSADGRISLTFRRLSSE
jgi:alkylated DNA repair dioxygenase AlkB